MKLTDLRNDEIFSVALNMNLETVLNFCQTNSKNNNLICNNFNFWFDKLNKDYNIQYTGNPDEIKDFYLWYHKLDKDTEFNYIGETDLQKLKDWYKYVMKYYSKGDYSNLLYIAAKLNNKKLIDKYLKLAERPAYLLFGAALTGNKELIDYFFQNIDNFKNLSLNYIDWAMYNAVEGNHRDLVDFFISKGADDFNWALYKAAKGNHKDLIDFFISKDANINNGLRGAAAGGHKDLVDFFISLDADGFNIALFDAASGNHKDLVDFFITKGANIEQGLNGAAFGGHKNLFEYLLPKINPNNINWAGILNNANVYGDKDFIDYLKEKKKINVTIKTQ